MLRRNRRHLRPTAEPRTKGTMKPDLNAVESEAHASDAQRSQQADEPTEGLLIFFLELFL